LVLRFISNFNRRIENMATYTVNIVYNGPEVDVASTQTGLQIARTFIQAESYVDTKPYEGTVWDTNVDGWGSLEGLDPFGLGTYKFAWFGQAIAFAAEAKKSGGGNTGVTFEVDGADEKLYWDVMNKAMASQGFVVTVTDKE
jgi:hypothetical protein